MTLPEIISLVSTVLLTTVALIVGIQLIIVLKELRYSLTKINRTLDTVSDTVDKIAQPALGVFAIIEGLKESGKIIDVFSRMFGKTKEPQADSDAYDTTI